MKTIITFCSIWDFFRYNWVMGLGSKIKRSQHRLAPPFQKPHIIISDHLLTWDLFWSATPKGGKESVEFPDTEVYATSFEKNSLKKIKYSGSSPSCYWGVWFLYMFWLTQKERPIEKNPFIVSAAVALFWWSRRFIYFFLILLLLLIMLSQPSSICVNSNIRSCILSLSRLHGTLSFIIN